MVLFVLTWNEVVWMVWDQKGLGWKDIVCWQAGRENDELDFLRSMPSDIFVNEKSEGGRWLRTLA